MKTWSFAFVLFFCVQWAASKSEAQVYYPPVVYYNTYAGYHSGWGWYPGWGGINFGVYPVVGYNYGIYSYNYPRESLYAAIAYSAETERVGLSWDYASKEEAIEGAEANCGHDTCKAAVWVRGGCAAIAKSKDADIKQVAWGYHRELMYAKANAMRACRQSHAPKCIIRGWTCSY